MLWSSSGQRVKPIGTHSTCIYLHSVAVSSAHSLAGTKTLLLFMQQLAKKPSLQCWIYLNRELDTFSSCQWVKQWESATCKNTNSSTTGHTHYFMTLSASLLIYCTAEKCHWQLHWTAYLSGKTFSQWLLRWVPCNYPTEVLTFK